MKKDVFTRLTSFLRDLERGKISYTLQSNREQAIMVITTVPGERWEVEFLADGSVEVERFISDGEIYGEEMLNELLRKYSEQKYENSKPAQGASLPVAPEQALSRKTYRKAHRASLGSWTGETAASQAEPDPHRSDSPNPPLQRTRYARR
jgi:hypothetical protein